MRQVVVSRILSYLLTASADPSRWKPIKEWIFQNMMGKDPFTKKGRKECARWDMSGLEVLTFSSNLPDAKLVELLELVIRRFYMQR
jgi:hypothetical protein